MTEQAARGRGKGLGAAWRVPALLALASTVGLVSALLGDGIWDVLSWLALGQPLAVTAWHVGRTTWAARGGARWAGHRRRKPVHGYNAHVATDARAGLARDVKVTTANVHDAADESGAPRRPSSPASVRL
ncbi:MAG: transposase [Acetobacteraceae bacterium]|nr:transposase [Acetobacteraceae bacterium]